MRWRVRMVVLMGCGLFWAAPGLGQDQGIADSLLRELKGNPGAGDSLRFDWLVHISFNHNNPDSALYYARSLGAQTDDPYWLIRSRYNEGSALRLMGALDKALQAYFEGLEYAVEENDRKRQGTFQLAIGDVYSNSGAHENSVEYYSRALEILRAENDSINLATALFNAGDEYFRVDRLDSASAYYEESGRIFEALDYPSGYAYNLGNLGMVYAKQGDDARAMANMDQATAILESQGDYYAISEYLTYISDIYLNRGESDKALEYAQRSLKLASAYGLKQQISHASLKLSDLYEQLGQPGAAYAAFKTHVAYRDSVRNLESVQQMADLRTNYEVSQKQAEVDLLNQQRKNQRLVVIATAIALLLIAAVAIGLYRRNRYVKATNRIIQAEKNRSDSLLLNILPEETARELKESGRVQAKKFESATILFTDFKGFTSYAEKMSPEELVQNVDFYFSKFDEIIGRYGLEKIKTIGDAYMCAGGLPYVMEDHAKKAVRAGLEIARFVRDAAAAPNGEGRFDIRIGINTGPVVAGVVGTRKFAYDIWGDAVNIASRMESASEPGKINISEFTYALIRDEFTCTYRGELEVKNRGKLKMYFVEA